MSALDRRAMVERPGNDLSVRRQCALVGVARSGVYRPKPVTGADDLAAMRRIDELHLPRSIFRKGTDFAAAMAFEMASTNLVVELAIIMLVFLGWQFTLAEFVGAPIMVALLIVL